MMMLIISTSEFLRAHIGEIVRLDRIVLRNGGIVRTARLAIIFLGVYARRTNWRCLRIRVATAAIHTIFLLRNFVEFVFNFALFEFTIYEVRASRMRVLDAMPASPTFFFFVITVRRITDMLVQCLICPAHRQEKIVRR